MLRSRINRAIHEAAACFQQHYWYLPPQPRWDVTDFGLGNFEKNGLVLVNLAEQPEYCEKLMYAFQNQWTPAHCHAKKKEDIICRVGQLAVQVWPGLPGECDGHSFAVPVNHQHQLFSSGDEVVLKAGERITLVPGVYHAFYPQSEFCIIGEVSTANDDLHDNFFVDPEIGRYSRIIEDEEALTLLIGEK